MFLPHLLSEWLIYSHPPGRCFVLLRVALSWFFILTFYICVLLYACLCIYARMCTYHAAHVGTTGQSVEVNPLLPPCGVQGSHSGCQAWPQVPLPLTYFAGPTLNSWLSCSRLSLEWQAFVMSLRDFMWCRGRGLNSGLCVWWASALQWEVQPQIQNPAWFLGYFLTESGTQQFG